MRKTMNILLIVAILYVLILVLLLFVQRRLIYLPSSLDASWTPPAPARVVRMKSSDGTGISGLFIEPPDSEKPVLLITHGNAGNIRTWADQLYGYFQRGYGGLLLDPRGYGLSEGSPDEEGCISDAEAALAWLVARGIAHERIVVHGISIGSGLAVPLAAKYPVRGLILQSPFTDLPSTAQSIFFFVPCHLIMHDEYDNLGLAPSIDRPTLILHGASDRTISIEHGRRLSKAFGGPVRFVEVSGWGHNGLHQWKDYWKEIGTFLR